jgi:ankyrin repeat protein
MQDNVDEFHCKRLIVRYCQKIVDNKFYETQLRKILQFDPSLATARIVGMSQLAVDGQTPLHIASANGNLPALKVLLEMGSEVSFWITDLQGRTPLHIAAGI